VPRNLSSPSSAATVVAQRVSFWRGPNPVLIDVDVTVGPLDRIGVVGPNGVGKTTLLRILAGLQVADVGGVVVSPPTATVGYLAQEPTSDPTETLGELLSRRTGVADAADELEAAAAALSESEPGADDRYALALERYLSLGGADIETRSAAVLAELGLSDDLLRLPTAALSGGQRSRSALAVLLLARHDVLLLDEPTNDLDFEGLERLEAFLAGRDGGLVVVSHDRAFLERVVTSVLDIDEATHHASRYGGGFAAYVEAKATDRRHAEEAYEGYAAERERLRQRERTQRQWAVTGVAREKRRPRDNDKAQRDFRVNRSEKQAAKIRITEKALARLEVVDKPYEGWELHLDLASAGRSGDVVASLAGAVVRRGSWQLGPVDLDIGWRDRVVVVGPNGSGKSTLIAALLGRVPLDAGARRMGPSVVAGELGQDRHRFTDGERELLAVFMEAAPTLSPPEARSLLAKFGLGATHVLRPAASLSPGERTRAELALLVARGTNWLVLDEPTNHLDLPAIDQLEQALGRWEGTLLLVSHDRRMLESVSVTRRVELHDGALALP
jgi:ATPase subunit of ABC transporter with duplicated ATPase domains